MTTFLLGVLSSITAAAILYLFRYQWGFIIGLIFFKLYPNISGKYNVYFFDRAYSKEEKIKVNHDDKGHEYKKKNSTSIANFKGKPSNDALLKWLKEGDRAPLKMELKQFANKIKGTIYHIEDGDIKVIEIMVGIITPSRTIILNSEIIHEEHHSFGTYLLPLNNNFGLIKGTRTFLCVDCGDATPGYILLEKTK